MFIEIAEHARMSESGSSLLRLIFQLIVRVERCHSQTLRVLLMSRCRAINTEKEEHTLASKLVGVLLFSVFATLVETRIISLRTEVLFSLL